MIFFLCCVLTEVWDDVAGEWCFRKAVVCDQEDAEVLLNVIYWLLSIVILMIRNGCLPKLRYLQSKVKQTAWEFGDAHIEILVNREGGRANTFIHAFIPCGAHAHTHTHAVVWGSIAVNDKITTGNLMTSCIQIAQKFTLVHFGFAHWERSICCCPHPSLWKCWQK